MSRLVVDKGKTPIAERAQVKALFDVLDAAADASGTAMTTLRDLLQLDTREALDRLGMERWLTVYSFQSQGIALTGYFCALVPDENLENALSRASWDLMVGTGMPGCSQSSGMAKSP